MEPKGASRDGTAEFFESLRRRGHEPLLARETGTVRFEIANGSPESWLLTIDRGDLKVSHARRKGDCTIRTDRETFDRIARGEMNGMAAVLRGEVKVEGDPELLILFQRLLPGPPR